MDYLSYGLKIKDLAGESSRVLVVDDDNFLNKIIADALADKNIDVDQAEDGVQATLLLENNKYDLVLCDIVMPGVDGLKILHFIRERDPELPFIMVTSQSDMKSVLKAIRLGISESRLPHEFPIIVDNRLRRCFQDNDPGFRHAA